MVRNPHRLWKSDPLPLNVPGQALAMRMADDTSRHDVAVFEADYSQVLIVENTGSDWAVRNGIGLAPGIQRVQAGDLGGSLRDEVLWEGLAYPDRCPRGLRLQRRAANSRRSRF